jgi:phosphinothricin acetyltransferase
MTSIRLATSKDAASILDIYAPFILNTAVTFETVLPTVENFEHRIISYQQDWPWLVFEIDEDIAGYAYATKHRERAAYQWCAESSVYVHESFQQKGIAKALYNALFSILKYQGCRNVYAGITLPNAKSISFHEKFGFTKIADYKNIGYKSGAWHTVGWWELHLNLHSDSPALPVKFPEVDTTFLKTILQRY